jgi:hypothetical protein
MNTTSMRFGASGFGQREPLGFVLVGPVAG